MSIQVLSESQTAALLPFATLCDFIADAARDYAAHRITSPTRQVLPLKDDALLLSMPATSSDIGIHKLVNFAPGNGPRGLPLIHGLVAIYSSETGEPLLFLDGPTVTARRTAGVSMLAIKGLREEVSHIALIGTGKQASGHIEAIAELFPGIKVDVHGRGKEGVDKFCDQHARLPLQITGLTTGIRNEAEVVIALTSSKKPIYHEKACVDRLLIGVGAFNAEMAEFAPACVQGSQLFADDPIGAQHEAGDLIQAEVNWGAVLSLADVVDGRFDRSMASLFKSVGCAAWDLAAGRCAVATVENSGS
ncbi:ornithine cyclodeaminase [Pseudomonas amygdali pv. eriobotryae]|uniref:Ornithine cyclodeaminase n=1 Tax=Pseudomonas amygdali pv. eriobotryae TaxID=129137 RepID=A0A0P9QRS0_PSEA0|nr:delta(1)-pyrroline-2-carboxylate reductase family protein [Pseudomonas amygdali]KPX31913.1 Ornithine cyclodeaminase/mu-crystallin [Pseudomonas amygdali pv. eriobotryae]KWS78373.1 ornithine cyclodeaminase [Pseudomonas amygdali pv. eriobotryae]RML95287.1 Ornithine cyclodeaminase/mu-crystallin [Pseudomonas amygdali pv. eriobotryae]GFZ62790.1 ornithine cyclodeaminase [Pseudomonas amygdali pv. eriobotryae]GFZ68136.1 ornithine cyclodeaminase [Pseudomonas amygdali pv. eriobotryae]